MRNNLEITTLFLFSIIAIASFIIGNIESGLGWSVATMLQLKILNVFNIFKGKE